MENNNELESYLRAKALIKEAATKRAKIVNFRIFNFWLKELRAHKISAGKVAKRAVENARLRILELERQGKRQITIDDIMPKLSTSYLNNFEKELKK